MCPQGDDQHAELSVSLSVAINTSSLKGKCSSAFQLKPLVCRGLRAPECESSSCQSACPPAHLPGALSWTSCFPFFPATKLLAPAPWPGLGLMSLRGFPVSHQPDLWVPTWLAAWQDRVTPGLGQWPAILGVMSLLLLMHDTEPRDTCHVYRVAFSQASASGCVQQGQDPRVRGLSRVDSGRQARAGTEAWSAFSGCFSILPPVSPCHFLVTCSWCPASTSDSPCRGQSGICTPSARRQEALVPGPLHPFLAM